MTKKPVPIDAKLIELLAGGSAPPLPFGREIALLECCVAGTSHVDLEGVAEELAVGQRLALRREPGNEHDPLAVLVLDTAGRKLGYLPRARNEVVSRLLDAGKRVEARLDAMDWSGEDESWLKLDITVLLVEL